ncbi:MAG: T9SS type A sorting domain-containing protein [Fibrobacteria bacterium]|nr:T9SS type A sorting domain-containing protein [Fibrobacteria bacterium]
MKITSIIKAVLLSLTAAAQVFSAIPSQKMVILKVKFPDNVSSKVAPGASVVTFEELVEAGITGLYWGSRDGYNVWNTGANYNYSEWINEAHEYGLYAGNDIFLNYDINSQWRMMPGYASSMVDFHTIAKPWDASTCEGTRDGEMEINEEVYNRMRSIARIVNPGVPLYLMDSHCNGNFVNWAALDGFFTDVWTETMYTSYLPNAISFHQKRPAAMAGAEVWMRAYTSEDRNKDLDHALFEKWFKDTYQKAGNVMLNYFVNKEIADWDARIATIKRITGGGPAVPEWKEFTQSSELVGGIDCQVQVKSTLGLDPESVECYYAQEMTGYRSKWIRHYDVQATGEKGTTEWVTIKAVRVPFDSIGTGDGFKGNKVRIKIKDVYSNPAKIRNIRTFKRDYGIKVTAPGWSNFINYSNSLTPSFSVNIESDQGFDAATVMCEYSIDQGKSWKSHPAVCSGTSTGKETIAAAGVPFTSDKAKLNLVRFSIKTPGGAELKSPEYAARVFIPPVFSELKSVINGSNLDVTVSIQDENGLRVGTGEIATREETTVLLHMEDSPSDASGSDNPVIPRLTTTFNELDSWKGEGIKTKAMCFKPGYWKADQWGMSNYVGAFDFAEFNQFPLGPSNEFTLATWVYANKTYNIGNKNAPRKVPIFAVGGTTEKENIQITLEQSNIVTVSGANNGTALTSLISAAGLISAKKWFYLALSFDGKNARLYIDGVEAANADWTGLNMYEFRPMKLGINFDLGGINYDGCLDEVNVTNRALTSAEIANDVYSGQYRYTTDGGQTWSAWTTGSINVADSSTEKGVMTMTGLPIVPNNDSTVRIEVSARDVNGNTAHRQFILLESSVIVPVTPVSAFTGSIAFAPNPFRENTRLSFVLKAPQKVDVSIYGVNGVKVRTLRKSLLPAGRQAIRWDGLGESGKQLSSGQYFARVKIGKQVMIKKLIKLK